MSSLSHYTIKEINKKDKYVNNFNPSGMHNIPSISDVSSIVDSRILKDFKEQTFGGYKIVQASAALDKAIMDNKLEPAMHWALQLFLSGLVHPLWNKLISFASKSINIYNVKLPEFLYNKSLQWQQITDNSKYSKDNILLLRNHPTIRLLLAELLSVLCLSKKRKINQLPKIKPNEFIIDNFKAKLEAKNNKFIDAICIDGDPSEIKIAINELSLHIYNSNINKALYWLSWIVEWEKINSKKYGKYECGIRTNEGVDGKYFKDVIWLIWAVILNICKIKYSHIQPYGTGGWTGGGIGYISIAGYSLGGSDVSIQIANLYKLYINKFTPASRPKKQYYIIWAILYITEALDYTTPLVDNPVILFQSILSFDKLIAQLKSQEVHHLTNTHLLNVVVENNYMLPEGHVSLEANKLLQIKQKEQYAKEQLAKQKKINIDSMDKLNEIHKLDRMMYA